MKRATLGDLLRELAMRADDEATRLEAITEHLSMDGVSASAKLATADKTIARQREELHRLREVLKRIAADACGDPCPDYSMCDGCQARAVLKRRKP